MFEVVFCLDSFAGDGSVQACVGGQWEGLQQACSLFVIKKVFSFCRLLLAVVQSVSLRSFVNADGHHYSRGGTEKKVLLSGIWYLN